MKRPIKILFKLLITLLFSLLLLGIVFQVSSQTIWNKYPGNLKFYGEHSGWYWRTNNQTAVIYDNGQYHLWYSVWCEKDFKTLGYATSTDGITWQRFENDSIRFNCVNESWDSEFRDFDIIQLDTALLMWYIFPIDEMNTTSLGFAWSKDGVDWNKYPEPVLIHGNEDNWDARGPSDLSVIYDGHLFRLYYSAYDKSRPTNERTGLATSKDGILWEKHFANPLIKEGNPGSWDDYGIGVRSVIFNGSNYDLWYSGNNLIRKQIGHASSIDGIYWTKSSENPVLRNGKMGERDSRFVQSPEVVLVDSVYHMWFTESDNYRNFSAYATTSTDEFLEWDTVMKIKKEIRALVFGRYEYIKVDSLVSILPELSGIKLVDTYNLLAMAYSMNDESKGLFYSNKALELAHEANYPEGRALALFSKGNRQYMLDNYGNALVNYLSSLRIYDSLGMLYQKGDLLFWIAELNSHVGSMDFTCNYARQALEVYEQIEDTSLILYSLNYLGYTSLGNGDTTSALEAFRRKLDLEKQNGNIWLLAENYCNLGLCYSGRILDSALYYFNKANLIYDSLEADPGPRNYNIIADAYFIAGPEYYKEAEEYYLKCYNKYWTGSYPKEVKLINAIAELYLNTGRYDKCRELLDISRNICELWLARLEHQLFSSTGKIHNEWFLKSSQERTYRLRFRLDTTLNNEASAIKHYILATQFRDSVYNDQKKKQWAMLQGQYETEKAQNQIKVLEKDNEVKNLTLKKTRIYLVGLGILLVFIVFWAILYIRNRKARAQHVLELEQVKTEKLLELDSLKSRFFANISHEFRTPLTLIMRPLEKLLSKTHDEIDKKELTIARKYAQSLQNLIKNLLSLSRLEAGKMQLRAEEINLVKLVNGYFQAFESLAMQKKITLKFKSESEEIKAFIDREKFEQVLNNLLSNAFKFTGEGGKIKVAIDYWSLAFSKNDTQPTAKSQKPTAIQGQCAEIKISDTGCGISPEHIDHIFNRFYQADNKDNNFYEGTGIGLALTKELVELHYGSIKVQSQQGKGSTFTVLIPLGKDHLKLKEIVTEKPEKLISPTIPPVPTYDQSEDISSTENNIEKNDIQPILLIVEDNTDMRSYIREYFEKKFQIIEAMDGIDGYEKSIEHIPDIIISDVMMPRMDGTEFCKKVKTDERTSHIPVVLLTARASKENRMEGLETGAEDFITKPFDGEELQVRVKNLINQRKRTNAILLRKIQKSHANIKLDFEDSGITSMDEQFLQKVIEIVNEYYTDPQFNTKVIGQAIGLGIIQLNRKIKALTGQTTVSFIRTFRLNRAAGLIKKKSATVAEIAYDVGFNSPSYFSECFRKYFGKLPSEFDENHANE